MLRHPPDILITTPESLFLLLTSRARGDPGLGRDGDRRRDPRARRDEARRAPRALAGAARGGRAPAAAADRPLGDAAAARGGGALPRRRRGRAHVEAAAGDDRRRRRDEGLRPAGRGAGRGHVPARRGAVARGRGGRPRGRPAAASAVDLAGDPPAPPRARARAPLDDPLRQQPPARRAAGRRRSTSWPARRSPAPTTARSRARSGCGSRTRSRPGELPALVATSSLELGIDMGAVDLVVQIETPPSVASGMQRIGRASHQVGGGLARRHLPEVPRRPAGDAPPSRGP